MAGALKARQRRRRNEKKRARKVRAKRRLQVRDAALEMDAALAELAPHLER